MATLSLAPEVLQWAAGNIGSTVEQLAARVAGPSKTQQVMDGKLTAKQAEKFASIAQVPFGFLSYASRLTSPIQKYPTCGKCQAQSGSRESFDTLADVKETGMVFGILKDCEADQLPFVGSFDQKPLLQKLLPRASLRLLGAMSRLELNVILKNSITRSWLNV